MGTAWWVSGPELLPEQEEIGRPLRRWLAATVSDVSGEIIKLRCADVVVAEANESESPPVVWMELEMASLQRLSSDELPDSLLGAILEIGIYGDGKIDGKPLARIVAQNQEVLS
jgi:hypothetical protein